MEKKKLKKEFIKKLQEGLEELSQQPSSIPASAPSQKSKETVVTFDKSTSPYEVVFSERGFEINDTRFSFEFIETALSKNVNVVLDKGKGLVLDSIKMEKILKYKDLYSRQNNSAI